MKQVVLFLSLVTFSISGFAHSYCFMAADVHQFIPVMWDDHHPTPYTQIGITFNQ